MGDSNMWTGIGSDWNHRVSAFDVGHEANTDRETKYENREEQLNYTIMNYYLPTVLHLRSAGSLLAGYYKYYSKAISAL